MKIIFILLILISCAKEKVTNNLKFETELNRQFRIKSLNDTLCSGCGRIVFGEDDLLLTLNIEINDCLGTISLQNIENIILPNEGEIFDLNLLDRYQDGSCRIEVNDLYLERENGNLLFFFIGEKILLEEITNN